MFNTATRAQATAMTSAAAWISNFMIAQVTPVAFASIGWRFYLVFAVCGFSSASLSTYRALARADGAADALFFWAFLPETRGLPLEEVDAYFEQVPLFVPSSKVHVPTASEREDALRAEGARYAAHAPTGTPLQEKQDVEHVA
jgi:hypothetical protein